MGRHAYMLHCKTTTSWLQLGFGNLLLGALMTTSFKSVVSRPFLNVTTMRC